MAELPGAPLPLPYPGIAPGSIRGVVRIVVRGGATVALLGILGAGCVLVGQGLGGGSGVQWALAVWVVLVCIGAWALTRIPRRASDHGPKPWQRDRRWEPRGETRGALARNMSAQAIIGLSWAWVSLYFFIELIDSLDSRAVLMTVLGATMSWLILRAWLQGGVSVTWDEFPLRTGARVRFHIATTAGGSSVPQLAAVLRLVRSVRPRGSFERIGVAVAEVPCLTPGPLAAGPEQFVTVEFDIPADASGTDLSRPGEERYWELVVLGTTAWGKIAETFVVPIYAVDGADVRGRAPAGES